VSPVDKLDPLVQHHIVNTLGWRELRDLQELSIEPILQGDHCLLIAPTAGGKTEAALLPVLSRICSENWPPLSVLYICPLKALLNNLAVRLERYTTMVGRRSAVWHGDIPANARLKIRREPPDILLTTPESLEAMLVSAQPEGREMLRGARVAIIDEIHAFAADDRGWHLLAVLERICRLAGREIQRIGLSATVGNPDQLLGWLAGHCDGQCTVTKPPPATTAEVEVMIDFVGSLSNAAIVISRLHRGEKRLVFCDSRSQVEELAGLLRTLDVQTYVSHSSLSVEDRRAAEAAFAGASDCVIVATSTLELGIDVGDLDRVIQIDAPNTVASFLQRLGRSGRRAGQSRNCLFLATSSNGLLRASAIVQLWRDGFIEPVEPPAQPLHVLAQQLMALTLQLNGLGARDWRRWLRRIPPFADLTDADFQQFLDHLLAQRILYSDGIHLSLGDQAHEDFGRRHFMELLSVFTTPPLLAVVHGRKELGQVDQVSVTRRKPDEAVVLSLGGRSWRVQSIDWKARQVLVEPSDTHGKSSWLGVRRGVSYVIARAVHRLLTSDAQGEGWSQRAGEQFGKLREEHFFLKPDADVIVAGPSGGDFKWHTLSGNDVNQVLAQELDLSGIKIIACDDFSITVNCSSDSIRLESAICGLNPETARDHFSPSSQLAQALKFSECLPASVVAEMLRNRLVKLPNFHATLRRPRRFLIANSPSHLI
jgi:ATP-dependent Lhr-like helicase